jgi:prepilin-type N-terminal cleavage/methylation domain-containing protein/prepilin-type processing-associated H-X9-DG protein
MRNVRPETGNLSETRRRFSQGLFARREDSRSLPFWLRRGFTLVELLVVIAILSILMLMLFPALGRGLENSRRAACRENLKQIGTAMRLFANDNKGWYPWGSVHPTVDLAGGPGGGTAGNLDAQGNLQRIITNTNTLFGTNYTRVTKVWVCPSDKFDGAANNTPVSAAPSFSPMVFDRSRHCSYMIIAGYNDWWSQTYRMSPVDAPVLTDEANVSENGNLQGGNMPDITDADNHGAGFRNVLFLDGHVMKFESADAANAIFDGILADPAATRVLQSLD